MTTFEFFKGEAQVWKLNLKSNDQPVDLSSATVRLVFELPDGVQKLELTPTINNNEVEFDIGTPFQLLRPYEYPGFLWINWPTGPKVAGEILVKLKRSIK